MKDERARILLVEDNPADVYLFRKALESAGVDCELIVIEDGAGALAFAHGDPPYGQLPAPHLAVLDLNLPKNDGVQVAEAIRAAGRFAGMPVVIASSSSAAPPILRAAHLQPVEYTKKPADLDEFLKIGVRLRELLAQSRGTE